MFVCQNDRKYNQNFEIELNLNDVEKLTTEDEIRMDDQDEYAIDQVSGWQCEQLQKQLMKESSSHESQTCDQPYGLSQALDPSEDPAHPHHD